MNWLFLVNGFVIGGCAGWVAADYFEAGSPLIVTAIILGSSGGLAVSWWLQRYWD
jgi:uncharacterized membrane protein YeaQ/YmgE (transglycosylase-associated protein family)